MESIRTQGVGRTATLRRSAAHLAHLPGARPRASTPSGIAEYDIALRSGNPELDQLLGARRAVQKCGVQPEGVALPEDDARAVAYLPLLWHSYEQAHGRILECYVAQNIRAGAVLTRKDELHIRYPTEAVAKVAPAFERTLWSCCAQFREAREVLLPGGGRRILLTQLYSLLVYLLAVLDSQSADGEAGDPGEQARERVESALETADEQLRRIRADLNQFAQRDGQQLYLLGMVPGIGALLALAFLTKTVHIDGLELQPLLVALAAGGVGAVVSLMTRIMGPSLRFDYHAGNALIIIAGMFRPIVGGVFGLALFVLLKAGLVQVARVPDDPSAQSYFFMGVAFLAGFSERWAHDILLLAGGRPSAGEAGAAAPGEEGGRPTPVSPPPAEHADQPDRRRTHVSGQRGRGELS